MKLLSEVLAAAGATPERVQKLAYGAADVHVDKAIANFSVCYRTPENLIADIVMPIVQVDKMSDKYFKWLRTDAQKEVQDARISTMGTPGMVHQSLSTDNYSVVDYALASPVPMKLLAAADAPLDLLGEAGKDVRAALAKLRELRVAAKVMNTASYDAALTSALTGLFRWDTPSTNTSADPIADILNAMDLPAVRPNTLVMASPTWTALRKHPKVLSSISGQIIGSIASKQQIADLFEVERVLVSDARYNTAAEGITPSYSFLWGKGVAMIYVEEGVRPNTLCFGKTFRHGELTFETIEERLQGVSGVTYVKAAHSDDEKVVATDAGYYLQTVIS